MFGVNEEDGLSFVEKTAQFIAYDRFCESQREDRLFNDHLATHFVGKYGKQCSDLFAMKSAEQHFDKDGSIGFGFEGFYNYHSARTKLISELLAKWNANTVGDKQIINMGAGVDTRPYWDESLKGINRYVEVDQEALNKTKEKTYAELQEKGQLNEPFCPRHVVTMNFMKESTKDLPQHGVDQKVKTCWVLEGLVMYLH